MLAVLLMNKFVFNAALPALLFLDIAKSDFYSVWNTKFVLFCFFVTLFIKNIIAEMLITNISI